MTVNTTKDTDKPVNPSNANAANPDASEPHGNKNEKLNENSPQHVTKEQRGDMTPEEYTNQPESNTNASVVRDIDEEPKDKPAEQIRTEITEAENTKQLEKDLEAERKRDEKERQELEQEAHANHVSTQQNDKLDSHTQPTVKD